MDWLYAVFFGAGVSSYTYTKMGRRVGYGNSQNVALIVGVVFILTSLFFFTVLKFMLKV